MIPTCSEFIRDKKISDRIYVWFLLNCKEDESGCRTVPIVRNGCMTGAGVRYETDVYKLGTLIDKGYIKKEKLCYIIPNERFEYSCKVNRKTAEFLLNSRKDNLIKLYCVMKRLYESNPGRGMV